MMKKDLHLFLEFQNVYLCEYIATTKDWCCWIKWDLFDSSFFFLFQKRGLTGFILAYIEYDLCLLNIVDTYSHWRTKCYGINDWAESRPLAHTQLILHYFLVDIVILQSKRILWRNLLNLVSEMAFYLSLSLFHSFTLFRSFVRTYGNWRRAVSYDIIIGIVVFRFGLNYHIRHRYKIQKPYAAQHTFQFNMPVSVFGLSDSMKFMAI